MRESLWNSDSSRCKLNVIHRWRGARPSGFIRFPVSLGLTRARCGFHFVQKIPNLRERQAREPVSVQTLVAEASIERFDDAFCVGLPGSINRSVTPPTCAHVSIARPQNSKPLSVRSTCDRLRVMASVDDGALRRGEVATGFGSRWGLRAPYVWTARCDVQQTVRPWWAPRRQARSSCPRPARAAHSHRPRRGHQ